VEISKEEFEEWNNSRVTQALFKVIQVGISLSLERKAQKMGTVEEIGVHNIYQQGGIDTAYNVLNIDEETINTILEEVGYVS